MSQLTTDNLQPTTLLRHIAVIMDGNRRWARQRGLPILAGHKYVADYVLEPLIAHAAKRGIKYMTFWAWSTENWKRNEREVTGIMKIFKSVIKNRWQRLHKKGVRVKVIGDISQFEPEIKDALKKVIEQTKNNKTITVVFALNYGGCDEIVRAVNKWKSNQQPTTNNQQLTREEFSRYLDTAGIPDPDIIVRPGGEKRLSGFLLWQSEYSEFYFADWMMPEFTQQKLDEIIADFSDRQRRFGR